MLRKMTVFILAVWMLLSLSAGVLASEPETFVFDDAGLLDSAAEEKLNEMAGAVSDTYGCNLYMMLVDDYTAYGTEPEIFEVTYGIYHDRNLGFGEGRDGILLVLSMAERDFAFFVYGEQAEYAFDPYGQTLLEEAFLDNFAENDWVGGFEDYLTTGGEFLELAAQGTPVRDDPTFGCILAVLGACVIAGIATAIQWAKMKNVYMQHDAAGYVSADGLKLTAARDMFTHRTYTRTKIQQSSSGSSSAHSGGGGSGRSGKF